MAANKNNISKVSDLAIAARGNPYVQRLIEDRELRQTLRGAYGAARSAYGRLNNGKAPRKALLDDRKLQRDLADAMGALREASSALIEAPSRSVSRPRRKSRARRSLTLLIAGSVLALVASKDLRSKVLDLLFGAEEEFSYSSTTAPAEPAPTATV
ncbi:MAG: hypothetical protein KGJ43_01750 [Acidobacteriota bacterium]|nr:hypothetical protein [Acidobacteriota bacterium]